MKKKIIHILTHSPRITITDLENKYKPPKTSNREDSKNAIKLDEYPHWVVFPINDWHVQFARKSCLIKRDLMLLFQVDGNLSIYVLEILSLIANH